MTAKATAMAAKVAAKKRPVTRELEAYDPDPEDPEAEPIPELVATESALAATEAPEPERTPGVAVPGEATLLILSDPDLNALKDGYDPKVFAGLAKRMIQYPKVEGEVEWIGDKIYETQNPPKGGYATADLATADAVRTTLNAAEREMVVLAVAVAKRDLFTMAGHVYWALMETKINAVEKVADVLMTAGTYCGIDNTRWAIAVYRKVLAVLRAAVKDGFVDTERLLTKRFPLEFPEY